MIKNQLKKLPEGTHRGIVTVSNDVAQHDDEMIIKKEVHRYKRRCSSCRNRSRTSFRIRGARWPRSIHSYCMSCLSDMVNDISNLLEDKEDNP